MAELVAVAVALASFVVAANIPVARSMPVTPVTPSANTSPPTLMICDERVIDRDVSFSKLERCTDSEAFCS